MTPNSEPQRSTIVAPATPRGEGAIAKLRLSGPQAFQIARQLFHPSKKKLNFDNIPALTLTLGELRHPNSVDAIDQVLLAKFPAPHSYTGEEMVEIDCHGGMLVVEKIVQALCQAGAILAEPGEFTKRAFLNGKLDLMQAEAIADLVRARTDVARQLALRQLQGELSTTLNQGRQKLLDIAAEIEARIDFPEEDDVSELPSSQLVAGLDTLLKQFAEMLSRGRRAHFFRDGARVALTGKPNTGKSCLFNALLGRERAIVTPHPGTTRDTIEATVELEGLPLTYIDTAGVREQGGEIERLGIERTRKEIQTADVVLFLVDLSQELTEEDQQIYDELSDREHLVVLNKMDLPALVSDRDIRRFLSLPEEQELLKVSALYKQNLGQVEKALAKVIVKDLQTSDEALLTNLRHVEAMENAVECLKNARQGLEQELSPELVMVDVNEALEQVNGILGLRIDDEILERIFGRFCLGK